MELSGTLTKWTLSNFILFQLINEIGCFTLLKIKQIKNVVLLRRDAVI